MEPVPLPSRKKRLDELDRTPLDTLVVGGGITGAGVALDLALRGLRVAVVEREDWAAATSSASSRLIHGGLRYLERFEFGLVRESCLERGLLLSNAAGIVWPERFVFPVHRGDPVGRLKLAAGLCLYTAVSIPRVLGLPRLLSSAAVARALPGVQTTGLRGGGSYLDAGTDDSRLTLAVVTTAMEAGAIALSRTELTALEGGTNGIEARLRDVLTGEERILQARSAVLAGGPFTDGLRRRAGLSADWVRPTRGAHILVPRERLPTDGAVILNSGVDGRILFLIPWPRVTVIGTTDLDASPADPVRATRREVRYLLDSVNLLVPEAGLGEADVTSTWAGLRPLLAAEGVADPSARSREERSDREGSIYTLSGGKLTGYRAMAERLGARIAGDLGIGLHGRVSPTRSHRLRGAHERRIARPPWSGLNDDRLPVDGDPIAHAWARRYAAHVPAVEQMCARAAQGDRHLDAETLLGEVDWAMEHEDALTVEDVLLRRTDLGLGPLDSAREAARLVLERMAAGQGWTEGRRRDEQQRVETALAARHAWRVEDSDSGASPFSSDA